MIFLILENLVLERDSRSESQPLLAYFLFARICSRNRATIGCNHFWLQFSAKIQCSKSQFLYYCFYMPLKGWWESCSTKRQVRWRMYRKCNDYKEEKFFFQIHWPEFQVRNRSFHLKLDNILYKWKSTIFDRVKVGRVEYFISSI